MSWGTHILFIILQGIQTTFGCEKRTRRSTRTSRSEIPLHPTEEERKRRKEKDRKQFRQYLKEVRRQVKKHRSNRNIVYGGYRPPSEDTVPPTIVYGGYRLPAKTTPKRSEIVLQFVYGGYRLPSVTLGVGRLQPPSTTDEERVAREKASVDAFRDALRMGWFKNDTDLMERFIMLLRTVTRNRSIASTC